MKTALTSPAVCSLDGYLYVAGGSILDGSEVTDLVQVYNPALEIWKELSPMQTPRTGCGACAFNYKVYVIGGCLYPNESLNIVECYDPSLDKWSDCPSMISNRHKPGVAVLNNKIYVCGGEALFNCYHDSIEAYDVQNRQWSLVTVMNSGRSWLSCATLRLQNPLLDTYNDKESENN